MSDSIRHLYVGRETTDGTTAGMLRAILCTNFKFKPTISQESSQEYGGNLATDFNLARGTSYGEFQVDTLLRMDQLGWFLACALGSPTSTLTGTGTNNVQTATKSGTWSAGSYYITIGGYQTAAIAFGAISSAIQSAINLLPSVVASGNCTVSGGPLSSTPVVFTFGGNLAGVNMPLITIDVSQVTGTTPGVSVANTTPGVGAYTHTFVGGSVSKPTLTFIEDDGSGSIALGGALSSGQKYTGARISSFDISYATTGFMKMSCKGMCHLETNTTSSTVPVVPVAASYANNPAPCNSLGVTFMGGAYRLSKTGKISVSNAIGPLHTVNSSGSAPQTAATDTARITEGFIRVTMDITGRYTGYSGSAYAAFIANSSVTSLVLAASSAASIGSASTPSATFTITNPGGTDAERMPFAGPETEFHWVGRALVDNTLATPTPLTVTLVNEEPRYLTLT